MDKCGAEKNGNQIRYTERMLMERIAAGSGEAGTDREKELLERVSFSMAFQCLYLSSFLIDVLMVILIAVVGDEQLRYGPDRETRR